MIKRNQYKTDPELHYLDHKQIEKPNICLVIPAYNEEKSIENVILDYQKQRHVNEILIIDNNSTDNTVSIAEKCNVKVIKKSQKLESAMMDLDFQMISLMYWENLTYDLIIN